MKLDARVMPAPRWKAAAWISAPVQSLEADVATELRQSMFRRLRAIIFSSIATLSIAMIAVSRHPTQSFVTWLILEFSFLCLRAALVSDVWRRMKGHGGRTLFGSWITDTFILTSTLWSALAGFAGYLIVLTNDSGLVVIMAFMCTSTLGALSIRNPSSPRLNMMQMALILVPFSVGALFSPIPLVPWAIVFAPLYLATMANMNRQIHEDYVAMIVAQIENRKRALHCSLTGLANRGCFDEALHAVLGDATARKYSLSVLCIDLDGFKTVNDNFGHPFGDALLVQVAQRLKGLTRADDLVARLGGDEFAILMLSSGRSESEALASRINRAIAEPFNLGPEAVVTIGASVGLIVLDGDTNADLVDAGFVMTLADQALYAAKHAGKGTFRRSDNRTVVASEAGHKAPPIPDLRLAG